MNSVFPYAKLNFKKKKIGKPLWKKILSTDNLKIGALFAVVVGFFLGYIITVTISSTRGYYYDQNLRKQEQADFQHNIAKLQNLKLESNLWSTIDLSSPENNNGIEYLEIER